MKRRIVALFIISISLLVTGAALAHEQQHTDATATAVPQAGMDHSMDHSMEHSMESMGAGTAACDPQTFVLQQQAYANALAAFEQAYQADPDAALLMVYNIGLTYQAFAQSCGFVPPDTENHGHGAEETPDPAHDHSAAAHMELAMSLGDPENGRTLFTTLQPQAGFACATCHRVDTTETLIGPGLVNVANPSHDPSQHQHGGAAAEPSGTPQPERSMDEVIAYIRTSILNPGDYVVPGFPDLLMPRVYGQIFSEQEVNDIIAYLLTLHE